MVCSSEISALKELRQKDCQLENSLVHITCTPLNKPNCYYSQSQGSLVVQNVDDFNGDRSLGYL